jgi:glyoxylase I family protein
MSLASSRIALDPWAVEVLGRRVSGSRRAETGTTVAVVIIGGIHHVSLNVADTARSLAFYCDTLGLAELPRPAFSFAGAWLDAGDGRQVHLIETPNVPPDLGQHIAFRVGDIDAAITRIRGAGYDVGDASTVADTTIRQTFARDPDGNRVELTQP